MTLPQVLVVAEKPKIAETIAHAVCCNPAMVSKRKGKSNSCPTWECEGMLLGRRMEFKVTSTAGHVYSAAFASRYNNWSTTDPAELFDAEIIYEEATPESKLPQHLAYEAKNASYLLLCLDNDREGENIAFEVIGICKPHMKVLTTNQIYRARFSALTKEDILRSFNNLTHPNKRESDAVRARQIIDLRAGCAFTRFQTKFFQEKYGDLDSTCISYGPCQTPTLYFCVDRQNRILRFQEQPYYKLVGDIVVKGTRIKMKWNRGHIFEKSVIQVFQKMVSSAETGTITSVTSKKTSSASPKALNTVTMLKEASARLGIGPQKAMHTAEHLYLSGYISYPRTETDCYPSSFDWKALMKQLHATPEYHGIVQAMLDADSDIGPHGGTDAGDHPPITPVKCATKGVITGDDWRLYDLVVRHFLASIAGPCKMEVTTYNINVSNEEFNFRTTRVLKKGHTLFVTSHGEDDDVAQVSINKGDTFEVRNIQVEEGKTTPPPLLTESDLLDAMEKKGIGTDASMATHVHNIVTRNYVKLVANRRVEPTKLGRSLLEGYMQIDPELVLPSVRATIESYCNMIAEGKADCDEVIRHVSRMFKLKFEYYISKIDVMNSLFEAHFTKLEELGTPLTRCGNCNRYMTFINKAPMRIICKHCSTEYSLPSGGVIRSYKELKCPLDNFELLQYQTKNRAYSICPLCYNDPPFEDFNRKGMSCIDCSHPDCPNAAAALTLTPCPQECNGSLIIDVINGAPNWKFFCTRCSYRLHVSSNVKKMSLVVESECETCGSRKARVTLKDSTVEEGCFFCCDAMKKHLIDPLVMYVHVIIVLQPQKR